MAHDKMGFSTFGRPGQKTDPLKDTRVRPVLAGKKVEEVSKPPATPAHPDILLRRFSINEVRKFPLYLDRLFAALQAAGVEVGMDRNSLENAFSANHFCLLQLEEGDKKVAVVLEGFVVEDEASAFVALLVQKKWGIL